jgi:predicted amidohydrolase
MKIATIQFSPVFGNSEKNIEKLKPFLEKAKTADLIVLPELSNSGYNFKDKNEAFELSEEPENSAFVGFLTGFCKQNNSAIVTGFNERDSSKIYNSALLIDKTAIIGKYRKIHLFMNEKEYFEPGNLMPRPFELNGAKIGMLVCFDWMFPEIYRTLALQGVDVICQPSNLVLPGKAQQAIPVHAMINRVFVVLANRTGTEQNLTYTGNSLIAGPNGEIIAQASAAGEEVLVADIDISLSKNKMITPHNHAFEDRRPEFYVGLTR